MKEQHLLIIKIRKLIKTLLCDHDYEINIYHNPMMKRREMVFVRKCSKCGHICKK